MPLRFHSLGRSSQALIQNVQDLALVPALPDALWVATAAPVDTLRFDKGLLAAVDTDGDGRIRSDELRASIVWALAVFRDPSGVRAGNVTLDPNTLAETGDGALVRDSARRISTGPVTLDEVRAVRAAEEAKGLSAAGRVLVAAAADDASLGAFLAHVLEVTGGEPHPSGSPSVTAATLDAYLAQGAAFLAWNDTPASDPSVLPIAGVADALAAHDAVASKLEQYFLLCDTVHLDPDVATRQWLEATNAELLDSAAAAAILGKAPLSRPRADALLDVKGALNPAWRDRIAAWLATTIAALGLDATRIDRALVAAAAAKLGPYRAWQQAKPSTKAGEGGVDALRTHVGDATLAERTRTLLVRSEAASVALDGVKLVERAILLQAWLLPLANTMVCIPDLYDTNVKGFVERGTLVMDGRVFELAIKVTDPARAERFAAMSPLYTMFVKVGEKGGALDEELMVPVTAGEREHLVDGMWGVFFDVDGRERHAQIRKMISNPISIKEAILAPFRKIAETVQSTLDKAASSQSDSMGASVTAASSAAADKAASAASTTVAAGAAPAAPAAAPAAVPAAPPAAPAPAGSPMGNLPLLAAGVGIALGAIGAFVTQALAMLFSATASVSSMIGDAVGAYGLPETAQSAIAAVSFPFSLVLVILGVMLVPFLIYATPVAIATWFRLRRRDLATLLEGSGWAINTRLYLDRTLAVKLTVRPPKPR